MPQPASALPLYTRKLPGGGYVTIEQVDDGGSEYRAYLRVERRADPSRREGHTAPVIAEASCGEPEAALAELQAIAVSNVSVARGILRWQSRRS